MTAVQEVSWWRLGGLTALRVVGVVRVAGMVSFSSKTSISSSTKIPCLPFSPPHLGPVYSSFPSWQLRNGMTVSTTNNYRMEVMACYYASPLPIEERLVSLLWLFLMRPVVSNVQIDY
ncbi:hypothetical protein ARMSODRAFT_976165 [Armillaria solidipes]|uniref:Uncharacterized protein n=1 Tax=Armillaria solidipes TaxID=1076256 RepID=A0A2H3BZ89_9AGAR|nr:hypothetical protein ARMSODRAFT_976165 [Armillaria solidipes]